MNFPNDVNADNKDSKDKRLSFIELFKTVENELYNIAKNKVYNKCDVDDILQETIIKIYKNFDSLNDLSCFKAWAIKILLNECNKMYRLRRRDKLLFDKIVNKNVSQQGVDYSITSFENDLCFKEMLNNVSAIEQNIFILHYQCNYSTKEIAKILNINENTIKSKLKRSKVIIKEKYMKGRDNADEK